MAWRTEMAKDTISAIEAARRLNVSLNFLYDLARVGKLDARKEGRHWRIGTEAVRERQERLATTSK